MFATSKFLLWRLSHSHLAFFNLQLPSLYFERLATPSLPYNLSQSILNLDNGTDATAAEDSTEGRDSLNTLCPFKKVLTENSNIFLAVSPTLSREIYRQQG